MQIIMQCKCALHKIITRCVENTDSQCTPGRVVQERDAGLKLCQNCHLLSLPGHLWESLCPALLWRKYLKPKWEPQVLSQRKGVAKAERLKNFPENESKPTRGQSPVEQEFSQAGLCLHYGTWTWPCQPGKSPSCLFWARGSSLTQDPGDHASLWQIGAGFCFQTREVWRRTQKGGEEVREGIYLPSSFPSVELCDSVFPPFDVLWGFSDKF